MVGGALAPAAPACNITISSPDLQQLNGCYVGQASSNSRGKWVKLDETATVEWQVRKTCAAVFREGEGGERTGRLRECLDAGLGFI